MNTQVITITRQFGSLGRMIGEKISEMMNFEYFDRDIIEKSAIEMGKPVYELSEFDGQTASKYGRMMFPLGHGFADKQRKLFEIEKKIILEFAEKRNCVIVGRCSDFILHEAEFSNVYSVFIYAPYNARFNYCLNTLGLTPEAAEVYIEKVDTARNKFYQEYTGEYFDSIKYRNLMVDSSTLSIDDTAKLICEGAILKFFSNVSKS
jgi:pyruvate carboxylase subunit A